MIKHRTLARGIGSSCFGILALASAAVYAQDGLADYHEDLSMYGSPRPAAAGGVSPSRVPEQVADIEEVSLDRRVVSRMIHDHRWQPVDPLGDYMEDFSGGVFEGGQIAGDKALFHIYLADQGERVPIVLGQDPHHGVEKWHLGFGEPGMPGWDARSGATSPVVAMMAGTPSGCP